MNRPFPCFSAIIDETPGRAVSACGAVAAAAAFAILPWPDWALGAVLVVVLVLLTAADLKQKRLPDFLTLPLLALGLVLSAARLGPAPMSSLAGAALGYAGFALAAILYRALRGRDGLGMGDAKLIAALGAWNGIGAIPFVVFFAAAAALSVYVAGRIGGRAFRAQDEVPFGPYLAISGWCAFLITRSEMSAFQIFS